MLPVAIAALIVSVVALVAAGLSATYTRTQAVETSRLRQIEASRRHDEREPQLEGTVEDVNGDGRFIRLRLKLLSSAPLSRLEVRIVEGAGVTFIPGTNGVAAIGPGPTEHLPVEAVYNLPAALAQGDGYNWVLDYNPMTGPDTIRIRVVCHGLDDNGEPDTWQVLHTLRMPFHLSRSFG